MKEASFNLFYETDGICIDTRTIYKNCLFICLRGENFNANLFAKQAIDLGAKYVIVDDEQFANGETIFFAANSLNYLQDLANFHRRKFKIPVIGITGSNGKTTTKELINAVLSAQYKTIATIGNLNNHIGVPLTLLRLNSEHEIAIIEMGANKFKDIEELCNIAEPNIAIITNIGKAHLEGFGSFEGVLTTKKELYTSINPEDGLIIFNSDDPVIAENIPKGIPAISYGTKANETIKGNLVELNPFVCLKWENKNYSSPVIQTQMIGKYNFYNFLAAITFGVHFNIKPEKINEALSSYSPENKRSQIVKKLTNTIILDCYNANPTSMRSAIESFSMIKSESKLAIIGDMLELGDESLKEHEQILNLLKEYSIPTITAGPIFHKLENPIVIHKSLNTNELIHYFSQNIISNRIILLKGSRGIGLEALESCFDA
jgi:UDP-N-acetylmuramoyl-tripeptide--D-alanyl-D-alanine ligase